MEILAIIVTKKKILILTSDYHVFDLSANFYDSTTNTVNLFQKSTLMSDKYPKLWLDSKFDSMKSTFKDVRFIIDYKNDIWLCFLTPFLAPNSGINYNVYNGEIVDGWHQQKHDAEIFISTDIDSYQYVVRTNEGIKFNMINTISKNSDNNDYYINKRFSTVCKYFDNADSKIYFKQFSPYENCENNGHFDVDWSIINGFVTDGFFHIVTTKGVLIFKEQIFHRQFTPFPVKQRSLQEFFLCSIPVPVYPTKSFFWLIAILIIILMLLFFIMFLIIMDGKSLKPSNKHRHHERISSSWKQKPSSSKRISKFSKESQQQQQDPPISSAFSSSCPSKNDSIHSFRMDSKNLKKIETISSRYLPTNQITSKQQQQQQSSFKIPSSFIIMYPKPKKNNNNTVAYRKISKSRI